MKNIFRFLMAVAVLFTASCAKEDISSSIAGGEVEVTFTASLPELGTRAYGDGAKANFLQVNVYDAANDQLLPELCREVDATDTRTFTFQLVLLKGMEYDIVLWADVKGNSFYTLNGKDVTVTYGTAANDDNRDAFYAYIDSFNPTSDEPAFTLNRPFAQLNAAVLASDVEAARKSGVTLTTSALKTKAYSALNLENNDATNEVEVTFTDAAIPTEKWNNADEYKHLSMNYLLVPSAGHVAKVEFIFKGKRADDSEVTFTGTTYDNVPFKQNYRTNILGSLLTKPTDFTVTIDAEFNKPDEFASRFDPANRTVTIGSAEEFLGLTALSNDWVAKFSNGLGTEYSNYAAVNGGKGVDYYYKWAWTVKLDADIDLKGVTLDAPIYVADWKLFDGQGHTIKNVNVVTASNTENNAGLFVGGKCGFKNIVLDNIEVTGSLVGNSTAAILAADCNSSEGATGITIKNSSVWGGKYTGGVVGYGYTHTTDCVLENCVIKGGYKLGGVIGYISSSGTAKAVDNHTLTNCTVAGTDGQYAGGKSEYVMGRVVGNFNTDGSCQNNKISNMTTVATENIGQIEAGYTVAE